MVYMRVCVYVCVCVYTDTHTQNETPFNVPESDKLQMTDIKNVDPEGCGLDVLEVPV